MEEDIRGLTDEEIRESVELRPSARKRIAAIAMLTLEDRKKRLLEVFPHELSANQKERIAKADEKTIKAYEYGVEWVLYEIGQMRDRQRPEPAFVTFLNMGMYVAKGIPWEVVMKNYRIVPIPCEDEED